MYVQGFKHLKKKAAAADSLVSGAMSKWTIRLVRLEPSTRDRIGEGGVDPPRPREDGRFPVQEALPKFSLQEQPGAEAFVTAL